MWFPLDLVSKEALVDACEGFMRNCSCLGSLTRIALNLMVWERPSLVVFFSWSVIRYTTLSCPQGDRNHCFCSGLNEDAIVVDSAWVTTDPKTAVKAYCEALGLPFESACAEHFELSPSPRLSPHDVLPSAVQEAIRTSSRAYRLLESMINLRGQSLGR